MAAATSKGTIDKAGHHSVDRSSFYVKGLATYRSFPRPWPGVHRFLIVTEMEHGAATVNIHAQSGSVGEQNGYINGNEAEG